MVDESTPHFPYVLQITRVAGFLELGASETVFKFMVESVQKQEHPISAENRPKKPSGGGSSSGQGGKIPVVKPREKNGNGGIPPKKVLKL